MPALPDHLVGARTVCYDMAYGREPTPFTRWADARHAERTAKGWGMLVEQAAVSFALWRGIRPNTKPVLEALAHQR
jgi:shikimate dehydrogenase